MTYMDLRFFVKGYLDSSGRHIAKFKNNFPGYDWVVSFLRRHKNQLTARMSENIKRARTAVSADTVNEYFNNLEITMRGVHPASVVNFDETNLTDDPGSKKIICRRGKKHPENITDFTKSSTSLMFSCSGEGTLLPIYVVYKAENLYDSWRNGGPTGTRYGCTKSGWFDQKHFEEWFFTIAQPYLRKQPAPRLLIGDNLTSHFSEAVLEACVENNISFTTLPKYATHYAQPLDVAFFRPLKSEWRKLLQAWRNQGNHGTLSKIHFPCLLKKLVDIIQNTAADNIKSGFRKSGIVPLDRSEVLKQLPNEGVDANPIEEAMDNSLISILRELRYGKNKSQPRTKRSGKLQVEPGRSVTNRNSNSESDPDDLSGSDEEEMENTPNSDVHEEQENVVSVRPDYTDIRDGDFLKVKLKDSKTNKEKCYASQVSVVMANHNNTARTVEVKFLKYYRNHKDIFVWPDIEERSVVYPHEVMSKLPQPSVLRYGRLKFPFII